MRRKDLSGDHEASGAVLWIILRRLFRWSGVKISRLLRLVMRMVLVGLAGWVNGGSEERSRVRCEARDEARDRFGDCDGDVGELGESGGSGESCGDSIADGVW